MAPKRYKPFGAGQTSSPYRFLSSLTQKHHGTIQDKGLIQEIRIDLHAFDPLPRVREIATGYGWLPFNNMLGECNTTIVEEYYANALAYGVGDYRSYVQGVAISYAPDVIDSTFGFRSEDYCEVHMRRASWRDGAITDAEYDQMRETLAMPGKDWRYSRQRVRDYMLRRCCLYQSYGPDDGSITLRHAPTRQRSSRRGA
ncbi:hypothetical protein QL285_032672 [Trifolium repens]|nr:hypothetical protein QL285_032672 [Trifolium repens]